MAVASMILGIISIFSICFCGGVFFGSLAILFAFLSKTDGEMESNAKVGLITGGIGLGLSILVILGLFGLGLAGALMDSSYMIHGGGMHA